MVINKTDVTFHREKISKIGQRVENMLVSSYSQKNISYTI